jgi:hypothetical protein
LIGRGLVGLARSIDMPDRHTEIPKTVKQPSRTDRIAAKSAEGKKREKLVDKAVEDSFPASDPPSYMGGATTGAPKKRPRKPDDANTQDANTQNDRE